MGATNIVVAGIESAGERIRARERRVRPWTQLYGFTLDRNRPDSAIRKTTEGAFDSAAGRSGSLAGTLWQHCNIRPAFPATARAAVFVILLTFCNNGLIQSGGNAGHRFLVALQ
jgi:hypothetical protein